jgi:hypothetical protein
VKIKDRANKMKAMPMPKKPMGAKEADMDLESMLAEEQAEPAEGSEEMESPEYQAAEEEMGVEMHPAESLSDDELLMELKKRGLMAKSSPVGKAAEADMEGEESEEESEEMPMPPKLMKKKLK